MGRFFVLIVDDQREVARLVRVSLEEVIGDLLEVRDVPSGEEALLELSLRPADLLIVDLGLPGLGGRELISKVHHALPHTRFIVLTGWDEGSARRAVKGLPVDEVLFKPVNIVDLVAAVRDALGLASDEAEDEETPETGMLSYEESTQRLSDLLAEARAQTGVEVVVLLDGEGRVSLRSPGVLPSDLQETLRRPLVYLHAAGLDVARALRRPLPDHLFFFQGPERMYALAAAAADYLLLWAQSVGQEQPPLWQQADALWETVLAVREILSRMGVLDTPGEALPADEEALLEPESTPEVPTAEVSEFTETSPLEVDEQVAALLETLDTFTQQAEMDPDAFWQEAASTKGTDLLRIDADALSYEEARRLGLVPDTGTLGE